MRNNQPGRSSSTGQAACRVGDRALKTSARLRSLSCLCGSRWTWGTSFQALSEFPRHHGLSFWTARASSAALRTSWMLVMSNGLMVPQSTRVRCARTTRVYRRSLHTPRIPDPQLAAKTLHGKLNMQHFAVTLPNLRRDGRRLLGSHTDSASEANHPPGTHREGPRDTQGSKTPSAQDWAICGEHSQGGTTSS